MAASAAFLAGTSALRGNDSHAQTASRAVRKLPVNAYDVGKLTNPSEMADLCLKSGFDGLDVVVRAGRYIEPANVAKDLPYFVNTLRSRGLIVNSYTANIYDADTPFAEAIMDTAAQLDLHRYRSGTLYYDRTKALAPQIDALKPRFAKLAKLLTRYKQNAMYHLYSDPFTVGSTIHDLLPIFKEHGPDTLSYHYDSGHAVMGRGINAWQMDMRMLGPYIKGVSIKDIVLVPNVEPGAAAFLEKFRNGLVGQCPPAPIGCTGTPGRWRERWVKLGTGYLDLTAFGQLLIEIGFDGPVEIQMEYTSDDPEGRTAAYAEDLKTLREAWRPLGLA